MVSKSRVGLRRKEQNLVLESVQLDQAVAGIKLLRTVGSARATDDVERYGPTVGWSRCQQFGERLDSDTRALVGLNPTDEQSDLFIAESQPLTRT